MRQAIVLAALFLSTPLAAQEASLLQRDKAGNEQYVLSDPPATLVQIEGEVCMTRTRLCLSINERDSHERPLLRMRVPGGDSDRSLPLDLAAQGDAELTIWPSAFLRVPHERKNGTGEQLIIGVEATKRLIYPDGNAHETVLWLYRIDNAGTGDAVARQVLSVPLDGAQSIRACFNNRDEKRRLDACADEVSVKAMLALDPANAATMPRLIYNVATISYPSDMPLRAPEDQPKQLTEADLVERRHPPCTYERAVAWNPATLRYEFDHPAPDCPIYGLER